ncbi:MAG: type IX secretion system membrane protein PorP/SprF [Cytophagales bacterium]|nr:MAG: type IX secretion system membrane protein PorP/SprF [Cytophagales bacterium]
MKKIITSILFTAVLSYGQQLPQYTQYMLNPYLINPAVAGTTDHFDIKAGYRNQWMGFNSNPELSGVASYQVAPVTFYVTAHGHIGKDHQRLRGRHKNQNAWHHGLGMQVISDRTGPTSHITVQGSYTYDMSLNKKLRMSFGAFVGVRQWSVNGDRIRYSDGSTGAATVNGAVDLSTLLPTVSFGTWLYHKYWYAGFSILDVVPFGTSSSAYKDVVNASKSVSNSLKQHYFLTVGAMFHPNKEIAVIPSILVRPTLGVSVSSLSIDLNTKVRYKNMIWGGLSYRSSDAFSVLFGVLIDKKYEIGLAYDYTINGSLRARSNGSFEIMLGYRIDPRAHVISPSDFW